MIREREGVRERVRKSPSDERRITQYQETVRIAHLEFRDRPLFLAPMEDVSDPPFRTLCKRFGADLLTTEFISSGGLVHGAEDSVQKLEFYESERPLSIQIFGGDLDQVREAAILVDAQGPDLIDINYGCPVKKVVRKDAGAGILRDLPKMQRLTEAVLEVATRPVTVKTRLGWNDESIKIIDVARMMEDVGVAALAVHARTRSQMYRGTARWEWFRKIKEEGLQDIPLIGNGDATSPKKIRAMFEETGVDAVMIGRGAIGNPWIFRDARAFLDAGEIPDPPTWQERIQVVAEHLTLKCAWLGERKGVLEMRRMYGGYFKGHRGASRLRAALMDETEKDGVLEVLLNWKEDEANLLVPVSQAAKVKAIPARLPKKVKLSKVREVA